MRPPVQRLILVAAFLASMAFVPVAAAQARPHTVDYVIGMLEAGVDQPTILARIHDKQLTFQIAEGDLDRLRAAGAGDALVQAVKTAAAPPDEERAAPGARSRPQRLGQGEGEGGERLEATTPERENQPEQEMEPPDEGVGQESEESEEAPHGGYPYYSPSEDWGYYGYYPPYYVYYGPPYYYYPYYPYVFYAPYPYFHNRVFIGGSFGRGGSSVGRTVPRGAPRGGSRPPSGGGMSRPRPRGH